MVYTQYIESAKRFDSDRQAIEYLLMLPDTGTTIYLMENIWVKNLTVRRSEVGIPQTLMYDMG